jgi:hypothetical protein
VGRIDYGNYKQRLAIEAKNKKRWLAVNPNLTDHSGIYFLTREEDGFKYAYIGQAKHILTRLAQHLVGFQRVDLSLKAHGLYSEDNPTGWKVGSKDYPITELDEMEQYYIKQYANAGYQLRNLTSGSQGTGKAKIDEYKPAKGYRDGIKQGYKNASRDISHLFDLHLDYKPKSDKPNKNQEKAMEKFKDFLDYHKGVEE